MEPVELLPDDLRRQLPAIRKIRNPAEDGQRMIFAKLFTRKTDVSFYVAEGEQRNSEYLLWGLLIAPQYRFPVQFEITLDRLQTRDWVGQEPCGRDHGFQPARWVDVERTIPNLSNRQKGPGRVKHHAD